VANKGVPFKQDDRGEAGLGAKNGIVKIGLTGKRN